MMWACFAMFGSSRERALENDFERRSRFPESPFSGYRGFGNSFDKTGFNDCSDCFGKISKSGSPAIPIYRFQAFVISGVRSRCVVRRVTRKPTRSAFDQDPHFPSSRFLDSWVSGNCLRTGHDFHLIDSKSGLQEIPVYRFRALMLSSARILCPWSFGGARGGR